MKKLWKKLFNFIARLLHIKRKEQANDNNKKLDNDINIISCNIRYIEEKNEN